MKVTAVIMAGGRGERFWPKSRGNYPKQFLSLTKDGETMIQKTVKRLLPMVAMEDVFVVTNVSYAALVKEQLPQLPEGVTQLDISHTAVTDIRTLTEASYHDLILSYQTTMDWETLGACNTYQFTVLDCPLDRQVAVRTALENRVEYATELPVQSDELLSKTMRGEISFS